MPDSLSQKENPRLLPISDIARSIGLERDEIELYGNDKAKVKLTAIEK